MNLLDLIYKVFILLLGWRIFEIAVFIPAVIFGLLIIYSHIIIEEFICGIRNIQKLLGYLFSSH